MSGSLPKQWLDRADEDLVVARLVLREGHTGHACFLAQQGSEKTLKAYLLATTNTYPRTHKLVDLLQECLKTEQGFAKFSADCIVIDQYYIPTRYPDSVGGIGVSQLPTATDATEPILAGQQILLFVTQFVP